MTLALPSNIKKLIGSLYLYTQQEELELKAKNFSEDEEVSVQEAQVNNTEVLVNCIDKMINIAHNVLEQDQNKDDLENVCFHTLNIRSKEDMPSPGISDDTHLSMLFRKLVLENEEKWGNIKKLSDVLEKV